MNPGDLGDRVPTAAYLDRARVAVVGESVQVPAARTTENRNQTVLGELRDLADGGNSPVVELSRGHRPDSP
jgi:hypothetical protein